MKELNRGIVKFFLLLSFSFHVQEFLEEEAIAEEEPRLDTSCRKH